MTTRVNQWGEQICHLKPAITDPVAHPSHRSIHSLLKPPRRQVRQHYLSLMEAPDFTQFHTYLKAQKGNSAPGPSKFRYSLLHHAPTAVAQALHHIVCICLRLQGLHAELKKANLFPIPK